jgi:hypothetical protein
MAPDPASFLISSLKKNLVENYMAPDPANFLHQLPQKESEGRIWLQILPTFFISSLKKNLAENYYTDDERGRVLGLNSFSQLFKAEFGSSIL